MIAQPEMREKSTMKFVFTLWSCLALTTLAAAAQPAPLSVTDLRCEALHDPLGIDVLRPRLSWVLESAQREQRSTAYQILVASKPERLAAGAGDLWDSGRVTIDASTQVAYAGRPLTSRRACWWKVRVWDAQGRPSAWSPAACWTMGLLKPDDWQGVWIGGLPPPPAPVRNPFEHAQWIWAAGSASELSPTAHVRRRFTVPATAQVKKAELCLSADDNYVLWINGQQAGRNRGLESWMRPERIDITQWVRPGENLIAIRAGNDPKTPGGLIASVRVQLAAGADLEFTSDKSWLAVSQPKGRWQEPSADDRQWPAARVVGPFGVKPWGQLEVDPPPPPPSPLLRTSFTLAKPIRSATVSICGLGYYELRLNGQRVGDHVLDPAFTRYDRRALYVTYDVTRLLREGRNAVGVQLGNGWYNEFTRSAWNFDHAPWRDLPKMLFQLDVELADGTRTAIASNASWKTTSEGPTRFDGIRNGEQYDARQEIRGWDTPAFNDDGWLSARLARAPGGVLSAQMLPPIRVTKTIRPVSVREPRPGVWLFDLGQNIAGHARINVRGPAGTQVVLRYGERLAPDGTLDQQAIAAHVYSGEFQTDRYTLRGGGPETWEPKFVYHGFQYVEVTGLKERPTLDTLSGRVVHTDFERIGRFACSEQLVNRIEQNAVWSYVGNFHGYPTDCPHREKNGWTGDAHLAADMGLLHFRGEAAYAKWMRDMADEQQPDGTVAAIIPTSGWGYLWGNGPAWDSAYLLIPYYVYQYRGDRRLLEQLYDGWRRYVDYLTTRADHGIVSIGLGDWCPAKTKTPVEVTSTAYYYVDTRIVAHTAALLGKKADAQRYAQQAEAIRRAFLARFYDPATGRVANGSQTALACALCQGLTGPAETPKTLACLVAAVDAADGHLDAGILGTKYLLHALSENGRSDVAWRVVTQTTPPGWGHWLQERATTLWEEWDGRASRNHIMFGDVSAWFIKYLGGIAPAAPGFREITIRPQVLGDLRWARAEHLCPYGWIRTDWRLEAGRFVLDLTVPVGTRATVYVPTPSAAAVTEGAGPAAQAPGVRLLRTEKGAAVFTVGSGRYRFAAPSATK